jgi:hypothetical protein
VSGASSGQQRTSTTSAVAGAALGSAGYRPSQSPSLFSLPSSRSVALDYGALIVPVDGAARGLGGFGRLGTFGLSGLPEGKADLLSLLGFPDFLREGRARASRRADGGLSGVQRVLGEEATIGEVGNGGALTFGQLPLLALTLVLFSSLLVVGAVLPPGVLARTPVSAARFARFRQPLALAAIAILLPVAFVALAAALS